MRLTDLALRGVLSLALLAAPAAADIVYTTVPAVPGPADELLLVADGGVPGDYPVIFSSTDPGPLLFPFVGEIQVGLTDLNIIVMPPFDENGHSELQCDLNCESANFDPYYAQIVSIRPVLPLVFELSNPLVLVVDDSLIEDCDGDGIDDDCEPDCNGDGVPDDCDPVPCCVERRCAFPADGHALWFSSCLGDDYVPDQQLELTEYTDGSARLTGIVARASDDEKRFFVDVLFEDRLDPGDPGYPPPGSPKVGPHDPPQALIDTWSYFLSMQGTMLGLGDYRDAVYELRHRSGTPVAQIGFGANDKNMNYGLSTWIEIERLKQPKSGWLPRDCHGDINIDIAPCIQGLELVGYGAEEAQSLLHSWDIGFTLNDGPLGGFDWEPGSYVETEAFGEPIAILTGCLTSEQDPSDRLLASVLFSRRSSPGDSTHPPSGGPALELPSSYYLSGGGSIDPSGWHYYERVRALLSGKGSLEDAVLLAKDGAAAQVGVGANGLNAEHGGAAWVGVWTLRQPKHGRSLDNDFSGEIRFVLGEDPCE